MKPVSISVAWGGQGRLLQRILTFQEQTLRDERKPNSHSSLRACALVLHPASGGLLEVSAALRALKVAAGLGFWRLISQAHFLPVFPLSHPSCVKESPLPQGTPLTQAQELPNCFLERALRRRKVSGILIGSLWWLVCQGEKQKQ